MCNSASLFRNSKNKRTTTEERSVHTYENFQLIFTVLCEVKNINWRLKISFAIFTVNFLLFIHKGNQLKLRTDV